VLHLTSNMFVESRKIKQQHMIHQ